MHTLYNVETQIPVFFRITEASVHDSKAMIEIPYEPVLITSLTEVITTSRCCIRFIRLKPISLSEQKFIKWKRRLPTNVLSDASILPTGFHHKQYYLEPLRLVKYRDEEQEREFTFITNATHISALQVAELYKNRWQVELFFKWLKQHLKIKKF